MKGPKNITIIGGGIAGLATAIALKNIGIDTTVFEAAGEIKPLGAGLGLGANAIKAFRVLGIEKEVTDAGRFLPSFTIYDQQGKTITRTDSIAIGKKYGTDNFTIHRADLHQILLSKTDPASIQLNKRVVAINQGKDAVVINFQDGTTHETDHVIAAEGIHSAVRKHLLPGSKIRYAGYTCWRAIIDNSSLRVNECSETWGKEGRFGIVPLKNEKIYWFACINSIAGNEMLKKLNVDDLLNRFKAYHQPIPSILAQTKNENLIWGDIIDLEPVTRYAFENILLIGDAAHATTPNLGQGACQAIEDAVILADEIRKNSNMAMAFRLFEKRRLKRTHWITNTSNRIGRIAQLENGLPVTLRNFMLRHVPKSLNDKQFKKLYATDF